MRIIFMGTPAFAVPTLDALIDAGHDVVAAYSQPPRAGGRRGRAVTPSPVQARAEALGIAVRTPVSLRDAAAQADFAALRADVAVVAAYGLILPRAVLAAPVHGCLNVHGSLLPRWRGAAPVQRAILAGDAETGVCIMQMEAGLDTGPVRLEGRTPVAGKTAGELTAEVSVMGAALMVRVLGDLAAYPAMAQATDGVTYAAKIDKAEARLDFSGSAEAVDRQVRAFAPMPGAFVEVAGKRVKVLACEVLGFAANAVDPAHIGQAPTGQAPTYDASTSHAPTRHPSAGWGLSEAATPPDEKDPSLRWGDDVVMTDRNADHRPAPGTVLDHHFTIACGSGAIRPTLVQRAGRGVTTTDDLLRGFAIPPGTRL